MKKSKRLGPCFAFKLIFCYLTFAAFSPAQQRIVGYYTAWNAARYPSSNISLTPLTHIIVAFAYPNADGTISASSGIPFAPLVQTARNEGKKILIALGGANNSTHFATVTADSTLRKKLIESIVRFLQSNQYDGVDIDWETPTNAQERTQLTSFVRELRTQLDQVSSSLLLTVAAPPTNWRGQYLDYPALIGSVDWFNVMTYDFYGPWSGFAGHNSPLYPSPADPLQAGSDSTAIAYLLSRGIPSAKLVLGVPFYAVQFSAPGLYERTSTPAVSYLRYNDVINLLSGGWFSRWDNVAKAPFLQNADATQFVTYEDPASIRLKAAFGARQKLGGLMCWELSQGLLEDGQQPLLEAMVMNVSTSVRTRSESPITSVATLYDSYPNPSSSAREGASATIQFDLLRPSRVRIHVLNILGQEVETRDLGSINAGSHYQVVDLSRWATGVYFYRLSIVEFGGEYHTRPKKMILRK
ncbi:MAG: hypothetical protein FJ215_08015 [Ignavibacteria bacterium]|nr:hypothetical protein [Ignavibacteria bacterium]